MDEGGESACWLDRVCPECGRLRERPGPEPCENCGATEGAHEDAPTHKDAPAHEGEPAQGDTPAHEDTPYEHGTPARPNGRTGAADTGAG